MRAVVYDSFGGPARLEEVPPPAVPAHAALVRVRATGVCRSDWHGWMGHDADITAFPHVPGHELAGEVVVVGGAVARWRGGERVTTPFVCACGTCACCAAGEGQVCERQTQPGFTHWGSWAELVVVHHADVNLVALPEGLGFAEAAALGCRVATAYRAVVQVGRVAAGEWVAVHGCGGVGLAAVLVARAAGARVAAIDPDPEALALATALGAVACAPDEVRSVTGGGAHLSLDAVGAADAIGASLRGLRRRGRHVQVGLVPEPVPVELGLAIAGELELLGAHGLAAHAYPGLLGLGLPVGELVTQRLALDAGPGLFEAWPRGGICVLEP